MGNSNSANKVSAQDRAILDMKIQRDKLHQYQKRITIITDREKEVARECIRNGDKKKALLALRRKKYQESLLVKADQQLAQLEMLVNDIEFAQMQKSVVFGLQQGTKVLQEIHKEMGGIENVEKLMGESQEAQAYQKEISEMLGNQLTNEEEDEVEDEFEALKMQLSPAEVDPARLPQVPVDPLKEGDKLPDVPQETPKERAKRRAEERSAEQGRQAILA